jgi:GNAT superfamily N-acetyltransferase
MTFTETRPDGLVLSDDQTRLDLDVCHAWLASSYWASDRSRADMERSFAGSRVYGVYGVEGRQVGLARAVTDGVTFCWIADVFVDDTVRGRGIGTWMVQAAVAQLQQNGVQRFLLGTRDAHGVYAKVGFTAPRVPQVFMELDERPTRPNGEDVDPAVLGR